MTTSQIAGPVLRFDASTAVAIAADAPVVVKRAAEYLVQQVAKRTGMAWRVTSGALAEQGATIRVTLDDRQLEEIRIETDATRNTVEIIAHAPSVMLAAVGQFARSLNLSADLATIGPMSVRHRPSYPIRGQIIANHKQNNTCDLWDWDEWVEYLTELAAWGNNLIILFAVDAAHWHGSLPFADPPWFDRPERQFEWDRQLEIQLRLPELCHELGMRHGIYMSPNDIWPQEVINKPSLAKNTHAFACPNDPEGRERITVLRRELFKRFPALDILFIPTRDEGGCPGCEKCDPWAPAFLDLVEEQTRLVREFHPDCKIWISQQGMPASETRTILDWLQTDEHPEVEAMVFGPFSEAMAYSDPDGPGSELSLEHRAYHGLWSGSPGVLRRHLPGSVELVLYPDEIHTYRSQYPVLDMDPVVQYVWNREDVPAPRIADAVEQFNATAPLSSGAAPYSEGDTDDVNKIAWSALLWDASTSTDAIARNYASWFWGEDAADDGAWLILAIERALHAAVLGDTEAGERRSRLMAVEERRPELISDWRWQSIRLAVELLEHIGIVYRRDRHIAANLRYRVAEWHEKVDATDGLQRTIKYLDDTFAEDTARIEAITATRARLFDLHKLRARGVVRVQHSYMGFDRVRDHFVSVLERLRKGELKNWRERMRAIHDALAAAEDSHRMASAGVQIVDYLQEYPWEKGATTWWSA